MSGMIKKIENPTPDVIPTNESPESLIPSWQWDESMPGAGERPEWLDPKYNKVIDQAKAYKEAEKRLGRNAPEDYEWGEYKDVLEVESPHLAELKNHAKELRLTQDDFAKIVDPLAKYHQSMLPNTDEEIKKLGPNAQARIDAVSNWASNNLSDKALDALGKLSVTADAIELMDEIRQIHSQTRSRVPTGNNLGEKPVIQNAESIKDEISANYSKYSNDSNYRADVTRRLKMALGEE